MMEPFFVDYLERLQELNSDFIRTFDDLPAAALDWVPGAAMNSLCVLVVHTTAATRFWIGDVALGESSNRNRDAEFQARGLSVEALKARFATLEGYVTDGLGRITLADLSAERNFRYRDRQSGTAGWALLHALEHVGIHLGHAQITRQLWEQQSPSE
jgi:uncharacterized damage-inducible protein DinB